MKLKKELKDFKDSFKLGMNFTRVLIYDILFIAIIVAGFKITKFIIESTLGSIDPNIITEEMIASQSPQIAAIAARMQIAVPTAFASVILYALIVLAMWSLSRGLIYSLLLKKKYTKKYFGKSILLNLILGIGLAFTTFIVSFALSLLLYIIPMSPMLKALTYNILSSLIVLILIYFITLTYIFFTRENKIFKSIGTAFEFGTKQFVKLIIPNTLILLTFVILTSILAAMPFLKTSIITVIIFALFLAWARIYFVSKVIG